MRSADEDLALAERPRDDGRLARHTTDVCLRLFDFLHLLAVVRKHLHVRPFDWLPRNHGGATMVADHTRPLLSHRGKPRLREVELDRCAAPVMLRIVWLERNHLVALAACLLQDEKRTGTRTVVQSTFFDELAFGGNALLAKPEELRLAAAARMHHHVRAVQRPLADLLAVRKRDDELGTFVHEPSHQVNAHASIAVEHHFQSVRSLLDACRHEDEASHTRCKQLLHFRIHANYGSLIISHGAHYIKSLIRPATTPSSIHSRRGGRG